MGTYTTYDGVLRIEPPLTWPEIQQSPSWPGHPDHDNTGWSTRRYGATLRLDEQAVDTPEGSLIRRTGEAVEITGEELRHNGVMYDLRALARLFGATHRFIGTLDCRHDHPDAPLPFRVRIEGTDVVEVHPVLLWPGDEKAETIVATTLDHAIGNILTHAMGTGERADCMGIARRILLDLTDLNRKK